MQIERAKCLAGPSRSVELPLHLLFFFTFFLLPVSFFYVIQLHNVCGIPHCCLLTSVPNIIIHLPLRLFFDSTTYIPLDRPTTTLALAGALPKKKSTTVSVFPLQEAAAGY